MTERTVLVSLLSTPYYSIESPLVIGNNALSSFSADIRFEADGFVSSASVLSRVSVRLSGELYWSPYCFDSRAFSFVLPGEPWYNTDRFRPVRRNEGEEP